MTKKEKMGSSMVAPILLFVLGLGLLISFGMLGQEIRCGMGHQYQEWSHHSVATCTKNGEDRKYCAVCRHYKKREIPKLGHTEVVDEAVAPDCIHDGKTEGKHCSVCNEVLVAQDVIPALGHDEVIHTEIPPTLFEDGLAEYVTCNRCGYVGGYEVLYAPGPEGLVYSVDDETNTCTVISIGNRTDWNVCIPAFYCELPVVGIDDRAFEGCSDLESVVIQDGVKYIGDAAFSNCINLKSVTIPASVTKIGSSVFLNCNNLISITIPERVTCIGDSAFNGCSSLTSITVPENVASIGKNAFHDCSNLTSITLPFVGATKDGTSNAHFGYIFGALFSYNNVAEVPKSLKTVVITGGTTIAVNAFNGCGSLTSITVPESVTVIGKSAFKGCSSLTHITLPFVGEEKDGRNNSHIGYVFGTSSYSNNDGYVPSGLKTIVVTGGTEIGSYAFYGCENLTSILIPESITRIRGHAFYGCSNLTSISIPESVTSIGDYAFYGCSNLISITIPKNVTSIKKYVFGGCTSLTSITIPENVTSIGVGAFGGCNSLTEVVFEYSKARWKYSTGIYNMANPQTAARHLTSKYDGSWTWYD